MSKTDQFRTETWMMDVYAQGVVRDILEEIVPHVPESRCKSFLADRDDYVFYQGYIIRED